MNFMELAKARYSCRKFTDQPVSEEQIQLILEAAQCAPTATNAQAYPAKIKHGGSTPSPDQQLPPRCSRQAR
jgi:nitroreductase